MDNWIDEILDDIDDPIVQNYSLLGLMESFIESSINSDLEKDFLLADIQHMRKSKMVSLMIHLKENQTHKDCKEQYKEMCNNGVFK